MNTNSLIETKTPNRMRYYKDYLIIKEPCLEKGKGKFWNAYNYETAKVELELEEDIPCLEFDSKEEVRDFICGVTDRICNLKNIVALISIDNEIFVTDFFCVIHELFKGDFISANPYTDCEIHIHEYSSYEEAYKVALAMKEPNPLCYEQ